MGYDAARIALGLADTDADLGSGEFFPHEANLDQLGGVSFKKGCYVGQEVVSRMEHRGTARSRILPVALDAEAPPKGSDIRSGEKQVGTLLSSDGHHALALVRLDRLADASEPLLTGAVTITVLKPRWARYDVPGAKDTA
jgi:folate-binding protein YgfZ